MGTCYLVIDRTVWGRSWGGFRVAEDLSLDEVKVLARTMTLKTILAGIPIGGAKGGVSLSTSQYDREEMLQLLSRVLGPYIKERRHYLGTDLGFTESDAESLYRSVGSKRRLFSGRLTVGEACANGILTSLDYVQRNGIRRLGARTVALEGFGRIGMPTAKLLSDEDYRIVAISNLAGTLYDPLGLNVPELLSIPSTPPENLLQLYSKKHLNAAILPRQALTRLKSEILIPGARAFVIDATEASQINAKLICPIANAPVTTDGEKVLAKGDITSLPDIITNAGGVIASIAQHLGADVPQTKKMIHEIISHNLDSVFDDFSKGEVPKEKAAAISSFRLNEIQDSEKIAALKFMSPWIRTLGLRAVLYGFKEYLGLKFGT
jgi:glutamate dehydrogenase (NAD(P)+)